MTSLRDIIGRRVLVADGAMGTRLQAAGLPVGRGGDRWNLEHPEAVEAIHRAYVAAGSDIILTNSFGAGAWTLAPEGLSDQVRAVNLAAAAIARRAAGPGTFVLGDVGPSGQWFAPHGTLTPDAWRADVRTRVSALLDAGADGIICETMMDVEEAVIAVEAALAAGARVVIASMAFDRTPGGRFRTIMGTSPEQAGQRLREAGATVVGANCGARVTVRDFAAIATLLAVSSGLPVMLQPNAGQPRLDQGRAVYDMTPEAFAADMRPLVDAGAAIVGGCCGTTPAHIGALRTAVDAARGLR
ncbi:MAG: homocysteine S-methyltransferase family protein [Acidobacteria bacterium]|nr:homocysteine S-methyltransferase family protein [Acidobacteriota bacterium]